MIIIKRNIHLAVSDACDLHVCHLLRYTIIESLTCYFNWRHIRCQVWFVSYYFSLYLGLSSWAPHNPVELIHCKFNQLSRYNYCLK